MDGAPAQCSGLGGVKPLGDNLSSVGALVIRNNGAPSMGGAGPGARGVAMRNGLMAAGLIALLGVVITGCMPN